MMRNILLTAFLFISLFANSQNQSWNANAINGQNYNIDSIVTTAGKTVLVDISANWCMPCWDWHITGIMEKIYKEFGPNGTNDLMVFFVDGDQGSSMACLQGACMASSGNWIAGTPYPIIGPYGQGHYVQSQYNMPAYPALFVHCPGSSQGVIINRENSFDEFLESWHDACPGAFDNGSTDAMLFHNDETEFCAGTHPFTDLFNQGTDTLFAATLTLKQNGTLLDTKNWTGALPPFQHTKVFFDNYIYSTAGTFEKEVIAAGDVNPGGNIETDSYAPAPTAPNTYLTMELNCKPETRWKLFDENGIAVYSSPTTNYQYNHLYTYNWVLNPNSCYTFQLYDSIWGDGLCCNIYQGFYKIRNTADTLNNFIFGGTFTGYMDQKRFLTPEATGIISHYDSKSKLLIYPNPTNGLMHINLEKESDAFVSVTNVLGETVITSFISKSVDPVINLLALPEGLYYVRVVTNDEISTHPVTLHR